MQSSGLIGHSTACLFGCKYMYLWVVASTAGCVLVWQATSRAPFHKHALFLLLYTAVWPTTSA